MTEKSGHTISTVMEEEVLPGYKTVGDLTKEGFKLLMEGIKLSNSLPSDKDWSYYTSFAAFKNIMNNKSNQLMDNITSILKKNDIGSNMRNRPVESKTEILVEANDLILEKVAYDIDEMNGIKKAVNEPAILKTVTAQLPTNINGSWNRSVDNTFSLTKNTGTPSQSKAKTIRLLTAENIVRPQKLFKDKIDNRNEYPWEPRIKDKPNSLKPLAIFLEETENGREFSHPYEYELDRFTPTNEFLEKTVPNPSKALTDTPLVEVNDSKQLPELVNELRKHKVIAVDLEHHSYRSFMGITCLMQISTPDKDYLVDTLALRNDLWVLNEIFTKSDILKVFHGADSDILWLQRDLSLYVVNMFDTYFAAKQLEYSGLSLAYLLQRFCNFIPNKQFQLADWRIRPLPMELKNYAREDTHYLIYIYQMMSNALIEKANGKSNLLKAVIDRSTDLCKKRYFKKYLNENSHMEFYRRCHRMFDNRQLFALKHIYEWRDRIAREEDESEAYVLPNNMLLEISGRLPKEMQGVLACCRPVPPLVKAHLLELHKIILKALERPFEEPILKEDTRARGSTKKVTKINVDSPLHCPHDLTKTPEFRDDLPTLLSGIDKEYYKGIIDMKADIEKFKSVCSIFNEGQKQELDKETRVHEKLHKFRENFKFLGPYHRYKMLKPYIEEKEKKAAEEKTRQVAENAKKVKEGNSAQDKQQDAVTDEERIESIREHFLDLSRKSLPQKAKPDPPKKKMSLLELGGSKKRKRHDSILRGTNSSELDSSCINGTLQTPVPNLQITINPNPVKSGNDEAVVNKQNRKRKSSVDMSPTITKMSRREINKNKMIKRKAKKAIAIAKNQGVEIPEAELQSAPGSSTNQNTRGRKKGKVGFRGSPRGKSNNNRNNRIESNEDFEAYDYSQVDYRQFHGGAGSAENSKEFKSKFKGRGKPNRGRRGRSQNNKAMSFGRGRGRGGK